MEVEFDTVDEVKPTVETGGELEEKKGPEVAQNDAGSAKALHLKRNKLFDNAVRSMGMPTSGASATDRSPAQLTIFYGGTVCVFDGIPADKMREIMLIAASAAATTNTSDMKTFGTNGPSSSPVLTRSPSLQSTATALASPQPQPIQSSQLCKLQAEIPIARRHSLQRFFEKRRDRLVSKNPYPTQLGDKDSDNTKAALGDQTSADTGCFDKPSMPKEEYQPKAAATMA